MITRCPLCQTAFRVTAAQLGAAAGLVRCGACGHVFEAERQQVSAEPGLILPPGLVTPAPGPVGLDESYIRDLLREEPESGAPPAAPMAAVRSFSPKPSSDATLKWSRTV